jgi:metal-sulfur cluster biosynthetic enzyme
MEDKVWAALKKVQDPELGVSVVDLGLIYAVKVSGGYVGIEMTATTPFCPYLPQLLEEVKEAAASVEGTADVAVKVVWDPPWNMDRMSEEARAFFGLL